MKNLIFRISPWIQDDLDALQLSVEGIDQIYEIDLLEKKYVNELLQHLYLEIGECEDYSRKLALIQLRRNLFNDKVENSESKIYGVEVDQFLSHLHLIKKQKEACRNKFKQYLSKEFPTIYEGFAAFLQREELANGLAMSGSELVIVLNQLNSMDIKKRAKATNALLKYISRITLKPTPFSQFTALGQATWISKGDSFIKVISRRANKSVYTINTQVFGFVYDKLINRKDIFNFLYLRLNNSLFSDERRLGFLQLNTSGEKLNFLKRSEFIEVILTQLDRGSKNFALFIEELTSEHEIQREVLQSMIINLIESGMIVLHLPVAPTTEKDWTEQMIDFLLSLPRSGNDTYFMIATKLKELRSLRDNLALSRPIEKLASIKSANTIFKSIVESLTEDIEERNHHLKLSETSNIIFEDYCSGDIIELNKKFVSEPLHDLEQLCSYLLLLDDSGLYRKALTEHFMQDFGETYVEFMRVYHWYHMKPNTMKIEATFTKIWESWNKENKKEISTLLRKMISVEDGEIIVDLDKCMASRKITSTKKTSFVAYLQFFSGPHSKIQAVLTGLYYGYGKMFSRFLNFFDSELTKKIKEENIELQGDNILFAENTDLSWSPLNFHPEILDFEISIPNGYSNYPVAKQIALKDISVGINSNGTIEMIHMPTDKEIQVLDLGMQNYLQRTKAHDFLDRFTGFRKPLIGSFINLVDEIANVPIQDKESIIFSPRISTAKGLVLRRAFWKIQKKIVPQMQAWMTSGDYMIEVGLFIRRHNLPSRFFVRLSQKGESRMIGIDHRKPQYICLSSPLFSDLFNSLLQKAEQFIYVEEFLPNSYETIFQAGQAKVIEFQHQFTAFDRIGEQ